MGEKYCRPFSDISSKDVDLVGGKCASLGEMTRNGIAVPPGFAVTTHAWEDFVRTAGIQGQIKEKLAGLNVDNTRLLTEICSEIRHMMQSAPLSPEIEGDIWNACTAMGEGVPVAVRSSATAEDLPEASFAGQQDTFLWVVGADNVVEMVRSCWASLYTDRAVKYRDDNNIPHASVLMAVAVQKMVNARSAGVAMTLDPSNGDRTKISVDASWGLGETVVSGAVTPDNFLIEKVLLSIVDRRISTKLEELVPQQAHKQAVMQKVDAARQTIPSVSDEEIIAIAALAKRLEIQNKCPQDVEWAIDADLPDGENLFALQTRPETVWSRKARQKKTKSSCSVGLAGVVDALLAPARAAQNAKDK